MVERLLVCRVRLLQVIHHQVAMAYSLVSHARDAVSVSHTETAPDFAVGGIDLEDGFAEILQLAGTGPWCAIYRRCPA